MSAESADEGSAVAEPAAPRSEPPGAAGSEDAPRRIPSLSLLVLSGPLIWFSDLVTRYFLVEAGADRQHPLLVLSVGMVGGVLALGASVACWRVGRSIPERQPTPRFMAFAGVALGAFSALAIGAALVPHIFFYHGTEAP
jgi:hypothetical protein